MKIVLFFLLMMNVAAAFAQKKRLIYSISNEGELSSKGGDCIRIIEEDESDGLYSIYEFYANRNPKLKARASAINPSIRFEGPVISYFSDGKRKSVQYYHDGVSCDSAYFYYRNGRLEKTLLEYDHSGDTLRQLPEARVLTYCDSLGNTLVRQGNGYCRMLCPVSNAMLEGRYESGYRHGKWLARNSGGKASLEYCEGKFRGGSATWTDGSVHEVSRLSSAASLIGNAKNFKNKLRSFVGNAIDQQPRPLDISFTIDIKGMLSNVVTEQGNLLTEEALGQLNSALKWTPATLYGLPVQSKQHLSISAR